MELGDSASDRVCEGQKCNLGCKSNGDQAEFCWTEFLGLIGDHKTLTNCCVLFINRKKLSARYVANVQER